MNLFLRPLEDINDVTWSIIWCLLILLAGVAYYIYTILSEAYEELEETSEGNTISHNSTNSDVIPDYGRDIEVTSDGEFF